MAQVRNGGGYDQSNRSRARGRHVVGNGFYFEGRATGFSDGLVVGHGKKRTCYSCLVPFSNLFMPDVYPFPDVAWGGRTSTLCKFLVKPLWDYCWLESGDKA